MQAKIFSKKTLISLLSFTILFGFTTALSPFVLFSKAQAVGETLGAPTLVTPDGYTISSSEKTVEWNAIDSTAVTSYEYAEYANQPPASDSTPPSLTRTVPSTETSVVTPASGSDSKTFWRVRAIDADNNVGPWSDTRTIITDRTNPTAMFENVQVGYGNLLNVTARGADNVSGVAQIGLTLYDASNTVKITDLQTIDFSGQNNTELYQLEGYDLSGLASSSYIIRAVSRDVAGNISNDAVVSITINTERPIVTVDDITVSTITAPILTGTIDDLTAKVYVSINNTSWVEAVNNSDGSWSYAVPNVLADGNYTIFVEAEDVRGNRSDVVSGNLFVMTLPASDNQPTVTSPDTNTGASSGTENTLPAPSLIGPAAFSEILGNDAEIPGAPDASGVEGAETTSPVAKIVDINNTDGNALGVAWYWWVMGIAGVSGFSWWIVALIRGKNSTH